MPFKLSLKYFKYFLLFLYGIAAVFVYLKFQYYYSPDAISYLSITEKIRNGDLYNSINAYWSPLISWVLVPFLFLFKDGILSFQIVNLLCGMYLLVIFEKITRHYLKHTILSYFILTGLALALPVLVLLNLTADIIFLTILMQYFYWQSQNKIYNSTLRFCLIGVLLLLSKTYGFYFFIVHQTIWFFYLSKTGHIKFNTGYLKKLLIFFICCSIWIGTLSYKYGQFTISTAAVYNNAIQQTDGSILHPCDTMQMIAPLPAFKYTAWEEMYLHTKVNISSKKSTGPTLSRLLYNGKTMAIAFQKFPRYGLLALVLLFAGSFVFKQNPRSLLLPASLFLIFTSGYLFFFINDRYLFFGSLLLFFCLVLLAGLWIEKKKRLQIPLCVFLLYCILRPAVDYYLYTDTSEEKAGKLIAQFTKSDTTSYINYVSFYPYQFANIAYENKWKNFGGLTGYKENHLLLMESLKNYNIRYLVLQDSIANKLPLAPIYSKENITLKEGLQLWKRK